MDLLARETEGEREEQCTDGGGEPSERKMSRTAAASSCGADIMSSRRMPQQSRRKVPGCLCVWGVQGGG